MQGIAVAGNEDERMTTPSAQVERVARALAIADGKDPDELAWVLNPGGKPFGVCWRDQYVDKAIAAIEAHEAPIVAAPGGGREE